MSSDNITGMGGAQMENDELPKEVVRLNVHERLQHLVTLVTFFLLVITGYMLKIPEEWIIKLGDWGEPVFYYRGITHRVAGVIMILGSVYHLVYLVVHPAGRSFMKDMIPTLKDAKDIFQNLAYFLGQRPEPPKFDRFDYKEKAEYLALVAGTIIISVTGIFLWSEAYWSKFVLDLSILIHGMEAILASLAIIVWHFYAVHWKPGQFPMSYVWIDGKMDNHHLQHEHPLLYEKLVNEGKIAPVDPNDHGHHHGRKTFCHIMLEFFGYVSIVFFLICSVLLVKLLYWPPAYTKAAKSVPSGKLSALIKTAEAKQTDAHFHNVDDTIHLQIANPPICVKCHGTFPHGKAPDIRSFLNMHNYFMACETCHVRKDDVEGTVNFVWFDYMTEETVTSISGNNGVYGARLVPVLSTYDGESRRLDMPANEDFIKEYIAKKDQLSPEEQAKAKVILHKDISKKPVQCTECHGKKPYIALAAVGYSPERAESLYRTEVADMISRYMDFYLPTMFDPDLMKKEKMKELKMEDRSIE